MRVYLLFCLLLSLSSESYAKDTREGLLIEASVGASMGRRTEAEVSFLHQSYEFGAKASVLAPLGIEVTGEGKLSKFSESGSINGLHNIDGNLILLLLQRH